MNRKNCINNTISIMDYGACPLAVNMNHFANINTSFRTALWTGEHLQITLMSIPVCGDIGLEIHSNLDQFIYVENGYGLVMMGKNQCHLNYEEKIERNYGVLVPAGTWHNIVNTGNRPLKLFSIYAPPQHPFGTVQMTKEESHEY